jgi:hypothetical protein
MENKTPTAEEYAKYMLPNGIDWYSEFGEMMIEFAKLHVEMALKEASENAELKYRINDISCNDKILDKKSILNAYPLTNIK